MDYREISEFAILLFEDGCAPVDLHFSVLEMVHSIYLQQNSYSSQTNITMDGYLFLNRTVHSILNSPHLFSNSDTSHLQPDNPLFPNPPHRSFLCRSRIGRYLLISLESLRNQDITALFKCRTEIGFCVSILIIYLKFSNFNSLNNIRKNYTKICKFTFQLKL
jgi:hypothetical protein